MRGPGGAPNLAVVMISQFDPSDQDAFRQWYATYHASEVHNRPWHTAWTEQELRAQLTLPNSSLRKIPLTATIDGRCVGGAVVELSLLDNLTHAYAESFALHPDHRADGTGEALLAAVESVARENGRTTLLAWWAYDLHGLPADDPFVGLALRNGFAQVLTEHQRALDLPVEVGPVDVADGYRLVTFEGRPPAEYRLGVRDLQSGFFTEAPSGVDWEPEVIDDHIEEEQWARLAAMDRTHLTTIAVTDTDEVVAYTYFGVPAAGDWCFQDATLVVPAHRGHGLGLAIKRANLAELQRRFPAKRSIRTWNAGDNRWMVAINDALGYRPVEALAELAKPLDR